MKLQDIKMRCFIPPTETFIYSTYKGFFNCLPINKDIEIDISLDITDKDNNDIYTNDIINAKAYDAKDIIHIIEGKVIFEDGEYLIESGLHHWPLISWSRVLTESVKLIGNVYQNKELLNE